MSTLQAHPLADIFPPLEGAEFAELVADVRKHGVREQIWIYQGKILDGRNRYRAAAVAGVPCQTRIYKGDDPVAFLISLNLKRRHLDESQRAMSAARLATMKQGARTDLAPIGAKSQDEAADLFNVARRSVQRARIVLDDGAPKLIAACDRSHIAVSLAAKLVEKTDRRFQNAVVVALKNGKVGPTEAIRLVRAARIAEEGITAPTAATDGRLFGCRQCAVAHHALSERNGLVFGRSFAVDRRCMPKALALRVLDAPHAALFGPLDRAPGFPADQQGSGLLILLKNNPHAPLSPRVCRHNTASRFDSAGNTPMVSMCASSAL